MRNRTLVSMALAAATMSLSATPALADPAAGPDHHANCTAGFAVGSAILDDDPGAVGTVAMPPKQFGHLSDVGYYSRTNCA